MTELTFAGIVDATGVDPYVGEHDVIAEVLRAFGTGTVVRVMLGTEPIAIGECRAEHGWCGTEFTPPDAALIEVGGIDLLDRLRELDGCEVLLVIDAPGFLG